MKYIRKNKTSKGAKLLQKIYKDKLATYDKDVRNDRNQRNQRNNYDEVINSLLIEQGYLCAYCMRKISEDNATIEHYIGQEYIDEEGNNIGKQEDTNYINMLAVCKGTYCEFSTKRKEKLHCDSSRALFQDQSKGNYRPKLFINPQNKEQMEQTLFTRSGSICYKEIEFLPSLESKLDYEIRFDINSVLNLNCENMVNDRKKIIDAIKNALVKHKFNKAFARKLLNNWENNQPYKEYAHVAILELKKHI